MLPTQTINRNIFAFEDEMPINYRFEDMDIFKNYSLLVYYVLDYFKLLKYKCSLKSRKLILFSYGVYISNNIYINFEITWQEILHY